MTTQAVIPKRYVVCKPKESKCNICGGFVPDGDCMCANGHEPGKSYLRRPLKIMMK
ncbi:MAG: hypothetical protein PHF44_00650 [Candidatus Pacebacteria bacterium]|nr:hypothetical protein [Candidatus Paceibacterota bacterium]